MDCGRAMKEKKACCVNNRDEGRTCISLQGNIL